MRFKRRRGAVTADLDPGEAGLLAALAEDLLGLLGEGDVASEDPLAAMVGLSSGPLPQPEDPALARLLPDAYADDDHAAAEFRRFTEHDLRKGKRTNAGTVLATLVPLLGQGGRLALDRDQVDGWLGWLQESLLSCVEPRGPR